MGGDINHYIDLVEKRLFELSVMLKEHRDGIKIEHSIKDIKDTIQINEDMLLCLRAARDFGRPLRLIPCIEAELPSRVLLRSVFPVGHPLHGRDDLFGEEVISA